MRIALLGVGLVGGSIARALHRLPVDQRPWIAAWSPVAGARDARTDGVVDELADDPEDALVGADLVVLASPASSIAGWIARLAAPADLGGALGPEATVTDVASTKRAVLAAADAAELRFVGGHPMAGRESSGYLASTGDLFVGRPWVIVRGSHARDADVDRVDWLARACGARPLEMSAGEHDEAAAAISHLPLLVAAALVESVSTEDGAFREPGAAAELASTGWASMTRLARGDPTMGAGILATNATPVLERLRELQDALDAWRAALEQEGGPDEEAIRARLAAIEISPRARLAGAVEPGTVTDAAVELVGVVPRDAVIDDASWHGIRRDGVGPILAAIRSRLRFEPRPAMEADPSYKQVIPYLVLRDGQAIFLMQRTRAGGDIRLHDRWSIGVGGHLDPRDGDLRGGLEREWREELDADFIPDFRLLGFLNDDTTDVGRVHLGAIFEADAAGRPVAVRETDKLSGSFVPLERVVEVAPDLESWSVLLLEAILAPPVR